MFPSVSKTIDYGHKKRKEKKTNFKEQATVLIGATVLLLCMLAAAIIASMPPLYLQHHNRPILSMISTITAIASISTEHLTTKATTT